MKRDTMELCMGNKTFLTCVYSNGEEDMKSYL